jgi:hypothetical protein
MIQTTPARHIIGAALGATRTDEGSRCACCGASPFGFGRAAKDVMGANFTDHDLFADLDAPDVCEGCARMLGGRPGDDPPPLRTSSFIVRAGVMIQASIDDLRAALESDERGVMGWAVSRQKHSSLRCGEAVGDDWLIGYDDGQIRWSPDDRALLGAVEAARMSASREEILSGQYRPHAITSGGARLIEAEAVICRYRGSPHLALAVGIIRRPDPSTVEESAMPTLPRHERAAEIVAELSARSELRGRDGLAFWNDILPRRLAAAGTARDIGAAVARLMRDLLVSVIGDEPARAVVLAEALTPDEARDVLALWRTDARLVSTLAFRALKERREAAS